MQIHITADDGVPIYQQIVNQVKYLVASGRLAAGEELPPIRVLAERLVINPNTVARAYRELEVEGIVRSRVGQGTTVAEGVSPLGRAARQRLMNEHVAVLVSHARHLNFSVDETCDLVRKQFGAGDAPVGDER